MKITSTLLAAAALLLSATEAICQPFTGKPTYKIEAKRAGVPIGDIHIELFPLIAPLHAANFDSLVSNQFYDSTAFHRVIPGFMIQGGDPNSRSGPESTWGYGQPGQPTVNAEFSNVSHIRGIMSAARSSDINSATSQFFIVVSPSTHLDNNYSAYGRVTSGMAVADNIVNSPRNAQDRPLQKIEMFISRVGSNDSVPVAPSHISLYRNSSGAPDNLTLSWAKVPDAAIYEIQVSEQPDFSTLVFEETVKQTSSSFTSGNMPQQNTYYWRIRTNNGGHVSPWSATFSTGIAAPALELPLNNAIDATTPAYLQWATATGADSYRVQVSTSPFFTTASTIQDISGITNNNVWINSLALNSNYYWRVQAVQNGVNGIFSNHWKFKAAVAGAEEELATDKTLHVYPNPVSEKAIIRFEVAHSGQVQLSLFDLNGRLISKLQNQQQIAGPHEVSFQTSDLPAGMYVLQLTCDDFTATQKLVVAK